MRISKKRVAILGSSGSIGKQSLQVIDLFRDRFEVTALALQKNAEELAQQIKKYKPKYVWISQDKRTELESKLDSFNFEYVPPDQMAELEDVDFIVVGIPGFESTKPVFKAVEKGKVVAVASKEAILCGGKLLFSTAERTKARIIPVDSEHSSLWRILEPYRNLVRRVYITASGGPFFSSSKEAMEKATLEDALKHPVWKMGAKITIDSALLTNKAFEVIEAHYLFSLDPDNIFVKIHPEAIVHAAVELKDGATIMNCYYPDMRIPIMYAMLYPEVEDAPFEIPTVWSKTLSFFDPDFDKFPSLLLGWRCAKLGDPFPCIFVSSNDVAVKMFIEGKIKLTDIYKINEASISLLENDPEFVQANSIACYEDIEKIFQKVQKIANQIAQTIAQNKK